MQIFPMPAVETENVGPTGSSNFIKIIRLELNRKVFESLRRILAEEEEHKHNFMLY